MGVVTTRGSFAFVILCVLLLSAGTAAATYPLPKFEQNVRVPDLQPAVVVTDFEWKDEIPQSCLPRDLFCYGPWEPWYEVHVPATGAKVVTNDTLVRAGHDPARKVMYGPYAVPTGNDDLRFCWTGCALPDPFYASAQSNVTLHLYVLGGEQVFHENVNVRVDTVHSRVVPRSWCYFAQNSHC